MSSASNGSSRTRYANGGRTRFISLRSMVSQSPRWRAFPASPLGCSDQLKLAREEAGRAVRALSGLLKAAIRESDAIGRIVELELVVLAPVGGPDEAAATRLRVEDEIDGAAEMSELQEFHIHCEAVVHDPKVIASSDALMTFAWVVEG